MLDHPKRPNIELVTGISREFPFWDEGVSVLKRKVIRNMPDVTHHLVELAESYKIHTHHFLIHGLVGPQIMK